MQISRYEILMHFGFAKDPFSTDYDTADQVRVRKLCSMAVNSGGVLAVVGERGIGKTVSVNRALASISAKIVRVQTADKPRVSIGDIETAMILDLSDETPRRSKELRVRQLRRILGETTGKHSVCIVLEEAHRMHGSTLRALKTLRELEFAGRTNMFSVIMPGQSNPLEKAGVSELRLRSDAVYMTGLSTAEILGYLGATVGSILESGVPELIAQRQESRNFLDLQKTVLSGMFAAMTAGRKAVSAGDVGAVVEKQAETVEMKPRKGVLAAVLQKRAVNE